MLAVKASVSHKDQEEQQGLRGFGSTALAAPSAWQVPGVGAALGARPCPGHIPVAMLAADPAQATSRQLCPHAQPFA